MMSKGLTSSIVNPGLEPRFRASKRSSGFTFTALASSLEGLLMVGVSDTTGPVC